MIIAQTLTDQDVDDPLSGGRRCSIKLTAGLSE